MKREDIKTIDVTTLTWLDKANGNTYFAQRIILNYCMPDEEVLLNPFGYGYSSYEFEAIDFLKGKGILNENDRNVMSLRKSGIIFRSFEKSAKKSELMKIR